MELSRILNIFRRYLWLLILVTLVASISAFIVVKNQPVMYEARARLLVGPNLSDPTPDLNSLKIGGQLILTYDEMENTSRFLESVNNKLDQKIDLHLLGAMLETKINSDTRILTIIVQHRDPKLAVAIAHAAAETLVEMSPSKDNSATVLRAQISSQSRQLEQIVTNAENSILLLESQLMTIRNAGQQNPEASQATMDQQSLIMKQLAEERSRLSDALRTLEIVYQVLLDVNTNQVMIIEPAGTAIPVDQNLSLKVAMTGVAVLLLSISIVLASEYFNYAIQSPLELSNAVGAPLLSTIHKHELLVGSGPDQVVTFAQPRSRAANDYRTAAAKLLFSMGESMPYTLLLSSVGSQSGDDSAMAVANLAILFAQSGNRVILVDAQFDNPVLTRLFDANGRTGLTDLLATNSTKLQLMPIKEVQTIRFLPTGTSYEKASGVVLNSAMVGKLIEEMQKEADIVLIAGSSISFFAESLTLASQVNSVILTARDGEAYSNVVNEVIENLRGMNARLAGVVYDNTLSPILRKQKPRNRSKGVNVLQKIVKFIKSYDYTTVKKSKVP